jgi:methionine-rich copper-binding protein CopC
MIMRYLLLPVCLVAVLALTRGTDAHAFLVRAEPAVGAVVAGSPKTVRIQFSEGLILPLSDIKVMNGAGAILSTNTHFEGANRSVLVVDLMPVPPGAYNVEWFAVSQDMHQTEGTFTFTVK